MAELIKRLTKRMGIKNTISDFFKLGEIKDTVLNLFEAKFELKKMEIQEKAEKGVAELIFFLILIILGSMLLIFLLILAAFGLNNWLGGVYGFVVISCLLSVVIAFFYVSKNTVKKVIREAIQRAMDAMDK